LAFFGVGLDPALREHETEELAAVDPKGTFLGVESDVICSQGFEDLCQIC